MKKYSDFNSEFREGWPNIEYLEPFFLAPFGKAWFNTGGNNGAVLSYEGIDGTEHLGDGEGRIDIRLEMWGNPKLGVLLLYSKLGAPGGYMFTSKGDSSKKGLYTRTLHNDIHPAWLYITFEKAWRGVKEFIEADGALPKSIEWISNRDLTSDTFPDPIPERLGGPKLKFI
jgi:hypothetical protein